MPEPNTFLLRAFANDPLISMSLQPPKKNQLDQTSTSHPLSSHPSHQFQVESNTNKPGTSKIPASSLEGEVADDSDLPSSVVEEIEVS
jgi:hypothetical protein